MQREDRFITIAGACALLVTISAFLWVHRQAIFRAGPSFRAARSEQTSDRAVESIRPTPVSAATEHATRNVAVNASQPENDVSAVVPASYGPDPVPGAERWPSDSATARLVFDAVRALTAGSTPALWDDAPPAPAEVQVCRDRDGRLVVAPGTHRRYDPVIQAIEDLDIEAFTASLDDLDAQWVEIMPGGPGLRQALATAIDKLLDVDPPNVEPDMVSKGTHWGFADSDYEGLSEAQKHLLLMGLERARIVRTRLEEIRTSIGAVPIDIPPPPVPAIEDDLLPAEDVPGQAAVAVASRE
jgi:hypothetical protein